MSEYTPGPWTSYKSKSVSGSTVYNIAQQDGAPFTKYYSDVCQTMEGELDRIQEANANLIAAAPELLESLECCLDYLCNEFILPKDVQNTARSAIAKAKGDNQ